jgi:hypothetical protein
MIKKIETNKYNVNGHVETRAEVVKEIKHGLHEGYHTVNIKGVDYPRSNPDDVKNNNVNK